MKWKEPKTRKFPLKTKARKMVALALKEGKLKRKPCEVCGFEKSEAHHPDYKKPLKVIWLCRAHHVQTHLEEKTNF